MNQLKKLLQELCPDGVAYIKLKTICDIYDGTHKTPNYTTTGIKFVSVENITNLYATEKYISEEDYNKYKVKPQINDVLMTRIGTIGTCTVIEKNVPLAYYVSLALLRPNTKILNSKYLKYYIESQYGRKELYKRTLINAVPIKVNTGDIGKISIFVPPLKVQREIVRILDVYSEKNEELIKELYAEIDFRKKQYAYYRDKLLNFGDKVEWRTLGEIAEVTDYVANGSFASLRKNVTYKHSPDYAALIRTVDFSTNFDKNKMIYIDKKAYDFLEKSRLFGGEIIINNIGGAGNSFLCPDLEIKMSLAPNSVMLKTANNKFYYYWLNSKYGKDAIKKITSKSTVPKFNKTGLRSILIPIPPLEEQKRIVEILDRFDRLCNDLTCGLPAEIDFRKRQYAYYRDKLLNFKGGF